MTIGEVRRLFSYTEWANARLIEAVRGLTQEQVGTNIVSSFPSVRETLAHIILAEWIWLRRWKGESPAGPPEWAAGGATLETLLANLAAIEEERRALLATLTDDDLQRDVDYRTTAGDPYANRLGDLMAHVVNHSTYHRGQLTTILRQLGVKPPATDMVLFFRNRQ